MVTIASFPLQSKLRLFIPNMRMENVRTICARPDCLASHTNAAAAAIRIAVVVAGSHELNSSGQLLRKLRDRPSLLQCLE